MVSVCHAAYQDLCTVPSLADSALGKTLHQPLAVKYQVMKFSCICLSMLMKWIILPMKSIGLASTTSSVGKLYSVKITLVLGRQGHSESTGSTWFLKVIFTGLLWSTGPLLELCWECGNAKIIIVKMDSKSTEI